MKLRVFTLTFDPDQGGFDDAAIQRFLRDKEALSVTEYFFTHEELPRLTLLVNYREVARPGEPKAAERPRTDWRAGLDPAQAALYDALREWRGRAARRDGVAVYLIFTNRQMAAVARARPATAEALGQVDGVGDARLRRWGAEVLQVQGSLRAPTG